MKSNTIQRLKVRFHILNSLLLLLTVFPTPSSLMQTQSTRSSGQLTAMERREHWNNGQDSRILLNLDACNSVVFAEESLAE
ncbi:hypothetical protein GALMADRAFT_1086346 [Galerina marginata CBS 339.88]|uniref:Uncharacterized protein n=1 Tax=Galerina marginata (strain CBS 339.88) TaxID=685588 RepID=A0A067SBW9_GALM3|nr:hypothetical protein GALMADRAFT_1086346 [Galerina marginata CBS 339.88]